MFSKLKEKLKESLSIFSRKAETEAVESTVDKVPLQEEKHSKQQQKEKKKETKDKSKKAGKKKEQTTITPKIEIEETIEELKSSEPIAAAEKESFFSRIKKSWSKKEETEAIEVEVKEAKKEEVEKIPEEKEDKIIPPEETEKKGFFTKIKETITTKTISEEKFQDLFWDLELVLLESNVSVEVIEKIKIDLKKELVNKPLPRDVSTAIKNTLQKTLTEILSFEKPDLINNITQKKKKPYVIAFFGINGAGKTTSIAKLTHYLQKNKLSVVLAASDTFRAAAIQQLEEHAAILKVKMIKHDYGADAAAVAFDAIKYAEKNNHDVVLIDTAGRLHSNTNLMAELEKIIRIAKPDLKLFVGESITGNDCIEQAQKFNDLVHVDGTILTKADIDEKGGAPLSIAYTIKKPIFFLGMGQKYEDFEVFEKEVILKRLGF
ncbi:MAG: signal recognition particle-docking protein FtsY [Nanoarchaeota archaeon]|nr:signal recognition particle-docking protein FtsY [Nanoarchaeota archaeon]